MSYSIKDVPNWDTEEKYNYEDTFLDYNELNNLNESLVKIGHTLKYLNKKLSIYEKQKAKLDAEYKHVYREAYMNANVKVESHRKIVAELACEELEVKILYLDQILRELNRLSYAQRTELTIIETIGHNIRRELNL